MALRSWLQACWPLRWRRHSLGYFTRHSLASTNRPGLLFGSVGAMSAGLAWVLAEPLPVIGAAAILTLVGVGLLTQVSQPSLLPGVKERNLLVRWDGPSGTSHPEMVRMVSRAANEIKAIPGVMGVGSHVGRAITSDHAVGINSGEIWIRIAPDADYEATLAAIQHCDQWLCR